MNIALSGLEAAINRYLKLDPDSIKRLGELDGKTFKIDVRDWNISYYITPNLEGVILSKDPVNEPCTTIKGDLIGLCTIGIQGANGTSLFENKIEIIGDTLAGEKMRDILSKIDIDWEEHLSNCVGDTAAHGMMWRVKKTLSFGKSFKDSLRGNFKDYLQHEKQILPTRIEVEQFCQDVSTIRDDVERAEARVNRLLNKND